MLAAGVWAADAIGAPDSAWHFVDRTVSAGLTVDGQPVEHGFVDGPHTDLRRTSGGAAAGDFDADGWLDLYVVRGDLGPNLLFRNRGDGTFEEVGATAGVDSVNGVASGPLFADLDGDGWLDLVVGGFGPRTITVFRNRGDGTFTDVTDRTGLQHPHATFGIACSDYDLDGDLDMYTAHWGCRAEKVGHIWRNEGDGTFTDVDEQSNAVHFQKHIDYTFTPNFADITNDGRPDLLLASDFETSQVFLNAGDGRFVEAPLGISAPDENGMGAAVGDYDNDGDLDWFVTSIWDFDMDPEGLWGVTGNRMYRNRGDGSFEDATNLSGVREGDWGWAASFGDLNNDGWLDLFMVNGWRYLQFVDDPARLFVNTGQGRFEERAVDLGVADTGQGRGVVCFDYDRDGDLDLLIANNSGPLRLFRNETPGTESFASIRLVGDAPNTQAVGARVYLRAQGQTQMRELRSGSNYVSSNPVEAHFGLGRTEAIQELRIVWPDGREDVHTAVPINRALTFYQTPTAIDLSSFSARRTDAGVRLEWRMSDHAMRAVRALRLQRAANAAGPFQDLESFHDPRPAMSYVDADPLERETVWYRLSMQLGDGTLRSGPTIAVDGATRAPRIELAWARADAGRVRVRYAVAGAPAEISLEVFDVRGRRLATPLRGVRPPGVWTHEWTARSDDGKRLSSGLYLVRLSTATQSRQVKLTLPPR